jgi:hypothetical protein
MRVGAAREAGRARCRNRSKANNEHPCELNLTHEINSKVFGREGMIAPNKCVLRGHSPTCSGFTVSHIRGIMGHARAHSPPRS